MSRWSQEPVRLALYPLAVAVVATLVALGYVTEEIGGYVLGIAAAVLAVPITEGVRSSVYSPDSVRQARELAYDRGMRAANPGGRDRA